MDYKNITRNTLQGGYWRLSKPLLHLAWSQGYDGAHVALYFEDLLQQEKWVENNNNAEYKKRNGWFYLLQKSSTERTGLSLFFQRKCMEFCTKNNLLKITRSGIPPRNYFQINHMRFVEILASTEVVDNYVTEDENPEIGCNKLTPLTFIDSPGALLLSKEKKNKEKSVGAQKSAPMKSGEIPEEIRALILKWNTGATTPGMLAKPSRHNLDRPSHTLQDITVFISALQSGTVQQRYKDLTPAWLAAENIPAALLAKKWTPAEIEAVMQDYLLCFQEGYWPYTAAEKQRLPKSFMAFLFSPRAAKRKSTFFYLAAHPPKKKDAVQSPETFKVCVQLFTKYNHAPTPIEKQQLAGAANELYREYQQIDKGIIPYCSPTYFERAGSLQKFLGMFSDFLEYLFQNDRDGMQMAVGMLRPGTKTWEAFLRYTEQEFNCPLSLWGVDPEAWAKGRFPLVLMFMRDKVREIGMDRARRRYGNRIPFMTFEEQTAYADRWKTKHGGRMPLAGEWGRGLYREIMKGEK